MNKIAVVNWISVDGIFSGPNGETDWFTPDDELTKENLQNLSGAATILFGRVTFKMMEAFWPTKDAMDRFPGIAAYMNGAEKHTFSTTVDSSPWQNSCFHKEISRETVTAIKEAAKSDVVILGSGDVSMALHRLGLIDEYSLILDPQLLGAGKPFFRNIDRTALQLLSARVFPSGTVRLNYKVVK
ncbi:dihydrofolate reductase family protein [Niabella aurantiaca]|uniref:dihydrofolate reductase family protein n=1 Tax=Niabella aurantiaca TaxID=379900 RepID=UPI00036110DF|nr:dihydrofolate reductase family protein [Niabella aurantiaca]